MDKLATVKCTPLTTVDKVTLKCCPTSQWCHKLAFLQVFVLRYATKRGIGTLVVTVNAVWHTVVVVCWHSAFPHLCSVHMLSSQVHTQLLAPIWRAILLCNWSIAQAPLHLAMITSTSLFPSYIQKHLAYQLAPAWPYGLYTSNMIRLCMCNCMWWKLYY